MADETKSNPAILIIGVVTFIVAVFFVGNIVAYSYAQKMFPKKPVKNKGTKHAKRQAMKRGVQTAGE